jgi:hypothetical protein
MDIQEDYKKVTKNQTKGKSFIIILIWVIAIILAIKFSWWFLLLGFICVAFI